MFVERWIFIGKYKKWIFLSRSFSHQNDDEERKENFAWIEAFERVNLRCLHNKFDNDLSPSLESLSGNVWEQKWINLRGAQRISLSQKPMWRSPDKKREAKFGSRRAHKSNEIRPRRRKNNEKKDNVKSVFGSSFDKGQIAEGDKSARFAFNYVTQLERIKASSELDKLEL